MLVLSRRKGERIMIGDGIVVTVLECGRPGSRHQVKLGIEAPDGVKVLREELCKKGGDGAEDSEAVGGAQGGLQ